MPHCKRRWRYDASWLPIHYLLESSLTQLGLDYLKSADFTAAQATLDQALSLNQALTPEQDTTADTLSYLGDLHLQLGNLESAQDFLERAYGVYKALYGEDHFNMAHCLICLGELHSVLGDNETAQQWLLRANNLLQDTVETNTG